MAQFPFTTPALRVEQPFGTFYVCVLPAELLLEVAFSDVTRVVNVEPSGYVLAGTQRKQRTERLAEVAKFIDTTEATFPTSVVLAVNYREDGRLEQDGERWRVEPGEPPMLVIPTSAKLASVVDGQHRLWAFTLAKEPDRANMPLVCSVFFDLPNPFQAYIFATVNFNQKKVDRSLAYELFGFDTEDEPPKAWTPEKAAVFLTRRLNVEDGSPLRGRVVVAPQDAERVVNRNGHNDWAVSTATVVDGLLKLFSRNPKNDRSTMLAKPRHARSRVDLPDDTTPARELYRHTNDLAIYTLVANFMSAANDVLWLNAAERSYITRTVGVQALFDTLLAVSPSAIEKRDFREARFAEVLRRAADIDFAENFFQASGKGRVRIKHTLALAAGLETLSQVPAPDRPDYARIVPSATA